MNNNIFTGKLAYKHLVLAGGGHTHSLLLRRWAKNPNKRPRGLITLINRSSHTLYSGMIPGVIAGIYQKEEAQINLRYWADKASVAIVIAEIEGLDLKNNHVILKNRAPIFYDNLSLDVGSETVKNNQYNYIGNEDQVITIKPFSKTLKWLEQEDDRLKLFSTEITVVGSGLAAIEIVFALRRRWPGRHINLRANNLDSKFSIKRLLLKQSIKIIKEDYPIKGPVILCTGNQSPEWLRNSGLPVNSSGRIFTNKKLQVEENSNIFAVGDCGTIRNFYRPPSGTWAVKAASPLARNLERINTKIKIINWQPQQFSLQLLGINIEFKKNIGIAFWGPIIFGPLPLIWKLKQFLDKSFMHKFNSDLKMFKSEINNVQNMECRGCAAKLAAQPLRKALEKSRLSNLNNEPEDSSIISSENVEENIIQSVDGFPALLSDPWLNARLTALHASSDLWACGGLVNSAQSVITLPSVSPDLQQELLSQCILGLQSALLPQGAKLVGGHTLESRSPLMNPITMGIQITLCVNGILSSKKNFWRKNGIKANDVLLLSRGLGSGVIFAAAMQGDSRSEDFDEILTTLSKSQHGLVNQIQNILNDNDNFGSIHACTDITGFGLLGHLSEMVYATNLLRIKNSKVPIYLDLEASSIPSLKGALNLIEKGYRSSLARENRKFLNLLESENENLMIKLSSADLNHRDYRKILELIIDPQTCGPLAVSCSLQFAELLISLGSWIKIGTVKEI